MKILSVMFLDREMSGELQLCRYRLGKNAKDMVKPGYLYAY